MKKFNISDGLFMVLALRSGLELAIVSGRNSKATDTRMQDLGIKHVLQGMKDKTSMLAPLLEELKIGFDETAFVGNEILDIKLASKVGLSFAVADSTPELIESVDYVTEKNGGKGAVREVIEIYFEAMNIDAKSLLV
jgi:3-deoxy-D-manno-octulosonate 8-phosphate phosphatase (KDO 8-P phosphatase)